jgi:tetratricopeptide (TPR) repeat protein
MSIIFRTGGVMISLLLVFVLLRPAVSRYYASLEPPGEQNISRASRIIPGNAAYHYVLGQFTFAVHDKPSIDKAIDRYLLSLARNPIDGRTWLALSRAYDDNGDHGAAEYAVRRAAAVDGSNATLSWEAGLFFLLRERFSDAAPFFRKYITIVPADQERVYLMLYALGVDPSYLLDNLVPYDYEHYKQYLRFLMSNNLVPDSIETWKRMADWKLERTDYLAHCNFLIDRGHIDEARAEWKQFAKKFHLEKGDETPASVIWNGEFEVPVQNGGFDWRIGRGDGVRIFLDTDIKKTGYSSLGVNFNGKTNPSVYVARQIVPVKSGQRYRVEVNIRTERLTTTNGLLLEISALKCDPFAVKSDAVTGTTLWRDLDLEFDAPQNCKTVQIGIKRDQSTKFDNKISGSAWIDSVTMAPISKQKTY